jgi:hypothetical protein
MIIHQVINAYLFATASAGPLSVLAGTPPTATNNASITSVNPSHQAGDRLICLVFSRGSSGTSVTAISCATAGWVTPNGITNPINAGSTRRWAIFENQCDSGSESNPTITFTGGLSGNTCQAVVLRFRNSNFANNLTLGTVTGNASSNHIAFPNDSPSINDGNGIIAMGQHNNTPSSGDLDVFSGQTAGLTWSELAYQEAAPGDDATMAVQYALNDSGSAYTAGTSGDLTGASFSVNNTSAGAYLEIPGP